MQQRAQTGTLLRQPSLFVTEHQLRQPLQHFMLPCLPAALRLALRATCTALHAMVDADAAFWDRAGFIAPELVAQPLDALQVQGILVRQGRALAHMRNGQPKACYVLPESADNWQLESNWSKCTANGSQFFTVTCMGKSHFNAIVDIANGRMRRMVLPRDDGDDLSQWLDERRLLTCGWRHKHCQVTAINEDEIVPLWSSGVETFVHKPILAAATPPALLGKLRGDDARMHLFSTSNYGSTELPAAKHGHFKLNVREMSWSPDNSHLALTFIQADHNQYEGMKDWDYNTVSIHKIDQGISTRHVEQPGFCKALWSPDSSCLALSSSQTSKIMIWHTHSPLQNPSYLARVDAIINWAYSPDAQLLAVCCRGEYDELPEDTDISSDESYPGSAYECHYHIFSAASSTLIATSQLVPYDNRVLPGLDDGKGCYEQFFFDVSAPQWSTSGDICFLPFVEQVYKKGHGIADVHVSHWAQLSPCGNLLVSVPCPLGSWLKYPSEPFTCPLEHFHMGSNKECTVLEEPFCQADDVEYQHPWLKVAWLPNPLGAQIYAFSGIQTNLVHLIDGRHDSVCCTWHIPSSCQVSYIDCRYAPLDIGVQWSPDGRSLAISAWHERAMVISFDHAAPESLEEVDCIWSADCTECHNDQSTG